MSIRAILLKNYHQVTENLFIERRPFVDTGFEKAYISLRVSENRFYTDEVVSRLPDFEGNPQLTKEWTIRKWSTDRLITYLKTNSSDGPILEIGCGNGWLSHQLATHSHREVLGIDINKTELEQGSRTFKGTPTLTFLQAEIKETEQLPKIFDTIVLASSLQYFDNIDNLLKKIFGILKEGGDIHIIDTPIYKNREEARAAKTRSQKYFSRHCEMEAFYFHHTFEELQRYKPAILHDPDSLPNKLRKITQSISPFPWVKILKN